MQYRKNCNWVFCKNKSQLNLILSLIWIGLIGSFSSCSDGTSINGLDRLNYRSNIESANNLKVLSEPTQNQQINGYVYFEDGTKLESWNPLYYIRAYYSTDTINAIADSEDEIDPVGGHYGISGINSDYPTGLYLLKTDFVLRNGILYSGRRWVFHTYGISTVCDITLYTQPYHVQIEGMVSFENGSFPANNPNIYVYYYDLLMSTSTIQSDGKYSFIGIPDYWISGEYFVETDLIYKKGVVYKASLSVSHEQFQKTSNQNLILLQFESKP